MINTIRVVDRLRLLDRKTWALGLFAVAAINTSIQAQDEDEEDIFVLSPFAVDASSDVGYRVTNSTSGTSLNTPIKDIPMSIEVINSDFLKDRGATSFDDALAYSSGVVTEEFGESDGAGRDGVNAPGANAQDSADRSPSSRGGLGGRFDNVVIIRGFNVPFQNRDGFRYGGLIAHTGTVLGGILDSSNIDRMEVVRGPNSLLYGIGVLSGIVNVIPKKPLSAQSGSYDLSVGSNGFLRSTIDVTGPLLKDFLGGQLNYRFAATYEEADHWTDHQSSELNYYVGQLQYQSEKLTVLVEGQYADNQYNGVGDQFIYDNLNAALDQNFRNEYGEQFNWSKDFDAEGNFVESGDYVDDTYRITGPDTYERRMEKNLMVNADYTPFENFTISAGAFITDSEEEALDVNLSTITNEERGFDWKVVENRGSDSNYAFVDEFLEFREDYVTVFDTGIEVGGEFTDNKDYRMVRYWWSKEPEYTSTEQYRLRMAYSMETEDFFSDSKAKHTFLVGRHDIRDEAQIVQGTERIDFQYDKPGEGQYGGNLEGELAKNDILQFRNIYDKSIMSFDPATDKLATPGTDYRLIDIWFTGHYALYQGQFMDQKLGLILGARHDRYQSRERIYDRFDDVAFYADRDGQEADPDNDQISPPNNPEWENGNNQTFGFSKDPEDDRYLPNVDAAETEVTTTIAINYKITDSFTVYGVRAEGLTPNTGALDGNYQGIDSEKSTSMEIGLKFDLWESKLSGSVALYKIKRENALWQYSLAPAPAKWPQITADGEVLAPINSTATGTDATSFVPWQLVGDEVANSFGKDSFGLSYGIDGYYFGLEGISNEEIAGYFQTDAEGNRTFGFPEGYIGRQEGAGTSNPRVVHYLTYDLLDSPAVKVVGTNARNKVAYEMAKGGYRIQEIDGVDYKIDDNGAPVGEVQDSERLTWRHFMELAFADVGRSSSDFNSSNGPEDFDPIKYDRDRNTPNNVNSSLGNATSANVTYDDESVGLDINLVYSVNDNWQLLFSYAHTEREATSPFDLVPVDWTNPITGDVYSYGTEYDAWVRTFGREAFGLVEVDSDGDGVVDQVTHADGSSVEMGEVSPTDLIGGLQGTSLYTGAEDSASIWSKYNISEGKFKNLGIGFGAVYTGPMATSIGIGGDELAANLYGTPKTKERLKIDAAFDYKWTWKDYDMALRFNVYNVTDDTVGESVVTYIDNSTGEEIKRRKRVNYTPRTYRLSYSVNF